MTGRTLITAFTAFDRFAVNPSALIAERLERPYVLLEVAYAAVDAFVSELDEDRFDCAMMLGVAGNSSDFRLERVARNHVGPTRDVRGFVPGDPTIDPAAAALIPGTLWSPALLANPPEQVVASDDAGGYLCNYLYFRMLHRFQGKPVGFLHVPPLEKVGLERQVEVVRMILRRIEGDALV